MAPKAKVSKTQTALKVVCDELARLENAVVPTDELLMKKFEAFNTAIKICSKAHSDYTDELETSWEKFEQITREAFYDINADIYERRAK